MRNGDCSVRVYWACNTTAATPIPMAERKSSPQSLAGIRVGFDRLPREALGTAFPEPRRDSCWLRSPAARPLGYRGGQRHRMTPVDRRYARARRFRENCCKGEGRRWSILRSDYDSGLATPPSGPDSIDIASATILVRPGTQPKCHNQMAP